MKRTLIMCTLAGCCRRLLLRAAPKGGQNQLDQCGLRFTAVGSAENLCQAHAGRRAALLQL